MPSRFIPYRPRPPHYPKTARRARRRMASTVKAAMARGVRRAA